MAQGVSAADGYGQIVFVKGKMFVLVLHDFVVGWLLVD